MAVDRRAFIASMVSTAALPAFSVAETAVIHPRAGVTPKATGQRPKNVMLIICDDLGYGDLGCYGSRIPTPNLDRLAAQGRRFTHYNSAHPICSASRAALLTGRYGPRSGVTNAFFPHSKSGMALNETTLANLFQNAGYRTQAIGKWHLGDGIEYLPTKRGFDSFLGVPYSVDMQPLPLIRDTADLDRDTDRNLLTPRYTAEALRFLEQDSTKPFFLYMAYSYPHDPARASPAFRGRSGLGDYGDAVHEIDASVGEIVRTLERKGLLSDTLVLFTSDHGPWYQGDPGRLRGRKTTTFEGGCRVPLIAHWPAAISAGTRSEGWASSLDILPTLTALCGLSPSPKPLDGIDISDILLGTRENIPRKALVYFTPMSAAGMDLHCARKGDWKLRFAQLTGEIYINDYTSGDMSLWLPRAELYNLALDPAESYNVSHLNPEIVKDISDDVTAQMRNMPESVILAFADLQTRVARANTPPCATPRFPSNAPLPAWAWEPPDRR